jgi:hypothetical protein
MSNRDVFERSLFILILLKFLAAQRDQLQSEIAQARDDPVQGGLIRYQAGKHRFAEAGIADGYPFEPSRPALADLALDPDLNALHRLPLLLEADTMPLPK